MKIHNTKHDTIPTKRQVNPVFAELSDRLVTLQIERNACTAEARELGMKIRNNKFSTPKNTEREFRAALILDGKAESESPSDDARLALLVQRGGDLDRAAEMLKEQIDFEGRRSGAIIVQQVAERHKSYVGEICAGLISTHRANQQYHKLAEALNEDSVGWTGLHPSHPVKIMGDPRDRNSDAAIYLRSAVTHGFIEIDLVPAELR